ncbi:hypothetical protein EDB87DRAFT_1690033 [Lactarius vividus]|nr:hypothetical protein EDB87DRAFT_1690033 [Lactarius vividus]
MLPFIFNGTGMDQEGELAVAAAISCVIACASIIGAREAQKEQRRWRRRTLRQGKLHRNSRLGTFRQRLQESQEDFGGSDDSSEEDDSMSTTETSTSDEDFSLDDDDDDKPPPAEKQAAPVANKKTTQPFEMGESGLNVKIANDPLPLPKKALAPAVNEDSGDGLIRAVPAKGNGKAGQGGKRKSLDDVDQESDAYIRPVKKNKTTARATMAESCKKNPAGVKLASKNTTVRKP